MKQLLLIIVINLSVQILFGQESTLNDKYKKEVIETLSILIEDFYIYPEVAKKNREYLYKQYEAGYFIKFKDNKNFAKALTEVVQSVNKDKHMRIMANKAYKTPENTLERKAEQRMDQINNYRNYNHGFKELKLFEENVAYLDLRGFASFERAKEIADAYMKLISQADSVIIDLTKNGGGDPAMVQYLCSYFFDQKLHLNSLYYRDGNRTDEYWTLDEVGGQKMDDIPLFIMISSHTFSGAEEFSYNMQTQKRAILVGQTSGGGANPGKTKGINENLSVFIPMGKAINPITKTSWEGVGVRPDISTKNQDTFQQTLIIAQKAANNYRKNRHRSYIQLHKELNQCLDNYKDEESEINIIKGITNFVSARLLGEWDINNLGYEYLNTKNKPKIGLCILKSNTILFPESQNVFNSYGEALKITGDFKSALENYQRALELASQSNDKNLNYYKEVVENIKNKINSDD